MTLQWPRTRAGFGSLQPKKASTWRKSRLIWAAGGNWTTPIKEKNPWVEVPALELDDGTIITESTAICHYLENLFPDPPLLGRTPVEKAQIMMWDRRVEQHGLSAVAEGFRNSNPFFEGRSVTGQENFEQIPALAERGPKRFENFLQMMDAQLAESEFVAGHTFSIADITGLITCDFAKVIKKGPPFEAHPNVQRWYEMVSSRDSAAA